MSISNCNLKLQALSAKLAQYNAERNHVTSSPTALEVRTMLEQRVRDESKGNCRKRDDMLFCKRYSLADFLDMLACINHAYAPDDHSEPVPTVSGVLRKLGWPEVDEPEPAAESVLERLDEDDEPLPTVASILGLVDDDEPAPAPGERWEDGEQLLPMVEDFLAAGAN